MIIMTESKSNVYDDLLVLFRRAEDGKLITGVHSIDKAKSGRNGTSIAFDYPDYDNKENDVRVMVVVDDNNIEVIAPLDLKSNIEQLIVGEYPYYKKNIR